MSGRRREERGGGNTGPSIDKHRDTADESYPRHESEDGAWMREESHRIEGDVPGFPGIEAARRLHTAGLVKPDVRRKKNPRGDRERERKRESSPQRCLSPPPPPSPPNSASGVKSHRVTESWSRAAAAKWTLVISVSKCHKNHQSFPLFEYVI